MSLSKEFENLLDQKQKILNKVVLNLYSELVRATPVDTGTLKTSWELKKVSSTHWVLSNNMEYAEIIFRGIRPGVKGGSKNLPDGVYPILQKFNTQLELELANIRA